MPYVDQFLFAIFLLADLYDWDIFSFRIMASSNERDRNDMEEIEQERTLNRMKVLSSRYFGGGDEEEAGDKNIDDNKSDIFRPISTICGRSAGIRSEFYPGRFGALQHHHHQQHPL